MKSTRIILAISWSYLLWTPLYCQQAAQNIQKAAPQAQNMPQPSQADIQKQIEAFVDSPEFKEMQEQLAPGMGNMTEEARGEFIKQTMQMYDYMQALPEEEQQKMAQAIEQDVQKMLQQEPQPIETQQAQEKLPIQEQPAPQPKPVVSKPSAPAQEDLTEPKQLLQTFINMLENTVITFSNLLRVSTDNTREHHWAKIQPEVQTTLAYIKTIHNSDPLLTHFVSTEFNVLRNQIGDTVNSLQKHYEHMITADDAMLRKLSPEDAARAQPVPKYKKKQAKKARNAIIDILYNETPNIEFGAKALFEKYAIASEKTQLKTELGKRMPQTRSTMLTKSGGQGSGSSGNSPRSDYYSPYYSGSGYQPSDSSRYPDHSSYDRDGSSTGKPSFGERGIAKRVDGASKKDDKNIPVSKEDKGTKAESQGATKPEKTPEGKGQKEYKAIKKDIDDLSKLVAKSSSAITPVIKKLTKVTDVEALRNASLAMQDINMSLTTLAGDISKWLRTVDKLDEDIKSEAKKAIVTYLKNQKDLQKLLAMARTATRSPIGTDHSGAQEVQGLLSECLKGYQDILHILKTADPENVLKTAQEMFTAINAQIKSSVLGDVAIRSAIEGSRDVSLAPDTLKIAAQTLQKLLTVGQQISQVLDKETASVSAQEKKMVDEGIRAHIAKQKELAQLAGIAEHMAVPEESDTSDQAQLARALGAFVQWYRGLI